MPKGTAQDANCSGISESSDLPCQTSNTQTRSYPGSVIGAGESTVMAGAILNPGVSLGDNVLVNTGALVEHDCILEPNVQIGPGANLAGNGNRP